ncbi:MULTISPECIES: polyribonucleotide nucleotidyltransferase [Porphyromonadaceae]|uniref:Polyribonucleotide nucleotidyltransferase n=1 Tax=Sanguibacteroides justesenii TaxID=1547597 RepID=A0A0C3MIX8_9PORP|nr:MULTISPECIES: polyribonucleotide nucleotidyltransferase [Porphyromonadaceae]KIO46638.1 polynucleotide phosphorylase [Sanguibacteroides justesenii]KIO46983.1 polynucleotide phosphorylase [Sanguibacteroides justesenii]PXZ43597.1 polyribonucleotide nucleotidyltransferase [Sanguibacteroides justesenii]
MNVIEKSITLKDGRVITLETGKLAKQADGAVMLKMGNTMILATVVSAQEAGPDVDFMPLSVDYKEKFSAVGRFPGGFTRREGRASDYEILVSRLIDRALRPLFPDDYHAETFVQVTLYSADEESMPDSLAGLAASAAIAVSDIPFHGPISEVRVARINGEFVINPTKSQMAEVDLDIMVAATMDNIMMVEGEMKEVSEKEMLDAIKFAHEAIKEQCQIQMELAAAVNKEKRTYCHEVNDEELRKDVWEKCYDKAYAVARQCNADKHLREKLFAEVREGYLETIPEEEREEKKMMVGRYYHDVEKEAVRRMILDEGLRLDGRTTEQIRPIWCEVGYLPGPHGSAVFTRGETQALATVTLGTKLDEKIVDEATEQGKEKFLLHYNFPPFSTGEAKPSRGVGRREVGHGNLAHRALKVMLPDNYPYTVRVVSDILESNGSSSMATVCAGTLAIMDAGIPMKKPVTGIAMGLITDKGCAKYAVLSDILGDEDHLGDMDFKVTGTVDGITATQMDIKVDGLPYEILEKALDQARRGRLHIMNIIKETLPEPRPDLKPHAPRMVTLTVDKDQIGAIIGPGGKIIQDIQEKSGAVVVIEEVGNQGIVDISASNAESIAIAVARIKAIASKPEIGEVYEGVVKNITTFGAFVEFLPGKDGLLHISEIDHKRLEKVEDALKEGDKIQVKLIDIDPKTGKFKLSRKVLLPKPERPEGEERGERPNRGPRPQRPERKENKPE